MRRNEKPRHPPRVLGSSSPAFRPPSKTLGVLVAAVTFLLAATLCGAQQSWEGNAAAVRSGTFPSPGLYAASDSFPPTSRIEVRSLASGKTVQVTVLRRIEDANGIFLLLSEQAAEQLGLSEGEVIRVSARVIPSAAARPVEPDGEQALNPDPDINPAAELGDLALAPPPAVAASPGGERAPEEEPAAEEAETGPGAEGAEAQPLQTTIPEAVAEPGPPSEEPPLEEPPVPAPVESPAPAPPASAETEEGLPPQPEGAATGITEAQRREAAAEQQRLAELRERLPQKQVFQPPRQSERFALASPEEIEAAIPEAEELEEAEVAPEPGASGVPEPAEEPQPPEIAEEPLPLPEAGPEPSLSAPQEVEEALVLQLPSPRPPEPERPEAEGTRLPAPEQPEPLALAPELPPVELPAEQPAVAEAPEKAPPPSAEPAEAPPPEVKEAGEPGAPGEAEVAVVPAEPPAVAERPLSTALTSKSYFLQIGAYSSRTLAEKLAGELGPGYEISILPAEDRSRTVYRVLIGPLNTDESGTLLYLFKARGFKDAFLRYVE
jgi:hypothetical protein